MLQELLPKQLGPMVGITTTVPVEILLSAGLHPVDLNNRFITNSRPHELISQAEERGMPRTLCSWIKGMYAWLLNHPEVHTIVAVTQGDCSNTHALAELLHLAGRKIITFEYPTSHDPDELQGQLAKLASAVDGSLGKAEEIRKALKPLRDDLARLDELTWRDGLVNGAENHLWQVSASDFDGDPIDFSNRLTEFLASVKGRTPAKGRPRLGLLGVPPAFSDLHETVEDFGGVVVFNEVQRQFAMPDGGREPADLCAQYLAFTYPYDIFGRIEDIADQAKIRGLDGLIHYTQTFCHRQIQDIALRQLVGLPVLTLEGDQAGPLDGRTKLRIEAFIEMMRCATWTRTE